MINERDIISISINVTFDYKDCSMKAVMINNFLIVTATRISKKGYIIKDSITVEHGGENNHVLNLLNGNRDSMVKVIEKTRIKALEFD